MECQVLRGEVVSQEGNTLIVKFCYTHSANKEMQEIKSSAYVCGALSAEFEFIGCRCTSCDSRQMEFCLSASVRFHKLIEYDDLPYTCKITSTTTLSHAQNELRICNNQWHHIGFFKHGTWESNEAWNCIFTLNLKCEIFEAQGIFASIYDDTQFTDFKLCCEDGSVEIHKTILRAFSPVLRTMLAGEWKESQEGKVALPGVSLQTLQHFKDYIYLNKLPETGLQVLYRLASYYMMPKLKVACCAKLLNTFTTEDVIELTEFAITNRIGPLYIAILKTVGWDTSKINKLALRIKWMDAGEKSNTEERKEEEGK